MCQQFKKQKQNSTRIMCYYYYVQSGRQCRWAAQGARSVNVKCVYILVSRFGEKCLLNVNVYTNNSRPTFIQKQVGVLCSWMENTFVNRLFTNNFQTFSPQLFVSNSETEPKCACKLNNNEGVGVYCPTGALTEKYTCCT